MATYLLLPIIPFNTNFSDGAYIETCMHSCPFPGNHTAINIAKLLGKMTDKWCIDTSSQVIAVTTDNAKNIINAITEELMLMMIPCAGHRVVLSVKPSRI